MSDSEDDVLAAEYVLGTLDPEERSRADHRLRREAGLRSAVDAWDQRLAPLLETYPDVAPPSHIFRLLMSRLRFGADARGSVAAISHLRLAVRRWRFGTMAAGGIAAALLAWIAIAPGPSRGSRFVAVLQKDSESPAVLLDVDVAARTASLRQLASTQPAGKSYEVWLINPEVGGPRSLGVLNATGLTKTSLSSYDAGVIARATYAVTVEPQGGSPTGTPSGPPILTGKLVGEDR